MRKNIQINGKTRDVIQINKDLKEKNLTDIIKKSSKAKKYLTDKKGVQNNYVKNKNKLYYKRIMCLIIRNILVFKFTLNYKLWIQGLR